MPNTEDLRYVRTEAAIRSAFMDLVKEVPVASVTASAVCRRAGISRNAFYLHHSSVGALYSAMVDELLDDVRARSLASSKRIISSGSVDDEFVADVLEALSAHEGLLRALMPADDGTLFARLADGIEAAFVDVAIVFGKPSGSKEYKLHCAFTAWSTLGMLRRWLTLTDQPVSGMLPQLSEYLTVVQADATRYLIRGEDA